MTESNGRNFRHCLLGMPSYMNQTGGAAQGFYLCSSGRVTIDGQAVPLKVTRKYGEGSALAQNFNILWCHALNMVHQGQLVDYFAMLHNDCEPQPGWVDELISELEASDLDVLGAAVAIKDHHGLTSLAIARDDGDSWGIKCRLTLKEIYDLPQTFTSRDVGGKLLINTGCWVCRFDPARMPGLHFRMNDRIYFDSARDAYVAQMEPEDWNFSRQCHALGLRVGATRKVQVEHVGQKRFTNKEPWGDPFDSVYLSESTLPIESREGWQFPYDVDGWLLPEEGRALADLADGKRVLEIGSYCGKSTICMAQTASHLSCVDTWDGTGTCNPRNTAEEFRRNIRRYGVGNGVSAWQNTSGLPRCFDLVFIDGSHDEQSVRDDIERAVALLKPDGLLAFHDYRRHSGQHDGRWDPGVTAVVNDYLDSGAELLSTHATVAVVRPPSPVLETTNA